MWWAEPHCFLGTLWFLNDNNSLGKENVNRDSQFARSLEKQNMTVYIQCCPWKGGTESMTCEQFSGQKCSLCQLVSVYQDLLQLGKNIPWDSPLWALISSLTEPPSDLLTWPPSYHSGKGGTLSESTGSPFWHIANSEKISDLYISVMWI